MSAKPAQSGPLPSPMFDAPFPRAAAATAPHNGLHNQGALREACGWVKLSYSLSPVPGGRTVLAPQPPTAWGGTGDLYRIRAEGVLSACHCALLIASTLGSLQARTCVSSFPQAPCRPRHREVSCHGQCHCHVISLQEARPGHPSRAWQWWRKSHRLAATGPGPEPGIQVCVSNIREPVKWCRGQLQTSLLTGGEAFCAMGVWVWMNCKQLGLPA